MHDDLFFARYRQNSSASKALAKSAPIEIDMAAKSLLSSMFDNAGNEDVKSDVVEDLLDVRLLPGTNVDGVSFSPERLAER